MSAVNDERKSNFFVALCIVKTEWAYRKCHKISLEKLITKPLSSQKVLNMISINKCVHCFQHQLIGFQSLTLLSVLQQAQLCGLIVTVTNPLPAMALDWLALSLMCMLRCF